jgi:hypothetical protein
MNDLERPRGEVSTLFSLSLEGESLIHGVDPLSRLGMGSLSVPRRLAKVGLVGESGGVRDSPSALTCRNKRQLRVLRGDPGVLGELHPCVLVLLVGDSGGVAGPETDIYVLPTASHMPTRRFP